MNKYIILCLLLLPVISWQCKKKNSEPEIVDYSCDCGTYGTNSVSRNISHPLGLLPYGNDRWIWGFIDLNGNTVIEPLYKEVKWFSNERALTWVESSYRFYAGFIKPDGSIAIESRYGDIDTYFSTEGLIAAASPSGKWGYLDRDGNYKISFSYKNAFGFYEGRAVVKEFKYGAIDVNGNLIIPTKYMVLSNFSEGKAIAGLIYDWLGYIGLNGEQLIPPKFFSAGIFVNGLAIAMDSLYPAYGYIDTTGNFKIPPQFQDGTPFWEYLAAVKVDDQWGFIDTVGNMVVQPTYNDVNGGFCGGLAAVKVGSKWGYINRNGQMVLQPCYKEADVFYCGRAMVLLEDDHLGYIDQTGALKWRSPLRIQKDKNEIPFLFRMIQKGTLEKAIVKHLSG